MLGFLPPSIYAPYGGPAPFYASLPPHDVGFVQDVQTYEFARRVFFPPLFVLPLIDIHSIPRTDPPPPATTPTIDRSFPMPFPLLIWFPLSRNLARERFSRVSYGPTNSLMYRPAFSMTSPTPSLLACDIANCFGSALFFWSLR